MIVGFDVCHDVQRKNLSYGALVATMNDTHTSFFSCVDPHASGEELSSHFAVGISSKLLIFSKFCRHFGNPILVDDLNFINVVSYLNLLFHLS